jgi:hypothetical protein
VKLKRREREIRSLAEAGNTPRETAATVRIAKITVDMRRKNAEQDGALNRYPAIANKLIQVADEFPTEYRHSKRRVSRPGNAAPRTLIRMRAVPKTNRSA